MIWTAESLLRFEAEVAEEFARGTIKAPVHLGGGNEAQLIEIFKNIRRDDWVLAGWRSHYHCLLKGVPREQVWQSIMDGHSVSLAFPEYQVLCSGIVGGIAPIACGLAWNHWNAATRIHVFLGDMSYEAGIVHESIKYAAGHELPIRWYVEDNGLSIHTNTKTSWGQSALPANVQRYGYHLTRPHAGIGSWVRF